MSYSELIKNFDNIRNYMRDFFVFGFKKRDDYDRKSSRSYDNERRRIQSYLGDLVSFKNNNYGKSLFITMDRRDINTNPLFVAFKSKSFTNKDITLYFIILDILSEGKEYSIRDILSKIEINYLSSFNNPMTFDESTLRKKIKEYVNLGIITYKKYGKNIKYSIPDDKVDLKYYSDAIRFFTEHNLLGVIGSYIEDKYENNTDYLVFKNKYIMDVFDSEIIYSLLNSITNKCIINITNYNPIQNIECELTVIPLKIYISTNGGRSYLICKEFNDNKFLSLRIDYIQKVKMLNNCFEFNSYSRDFELISENMWGVVIKDLTKIEHIEIYIFVDDGEEYIVNRLHREKRKGDFEKIDRNTYRFKANIFDAQEMIPWIRTFFGRIKNIKCSNKIIRKKLEDDIIKMINLYGDEDVI